MTSPLRPGRRQRMGHFYRRTGFQPSPTGNEDDMYIGVGTIIVILLIIILILLL
jgi:hypothetical protein